MHFDLENEKPKKIFEENFESPGYSPKWKSTFTIPKLDDIKNYNPPHKGPAIKINHLESMMKSEEFEASISSSSSRSSDYEDSNTQLS